MGTGRTTWVAILELMQRLARVNMLSSSTLRLCPAQTEKFPTTSYQAILDHRQVPGQPREHYPSNLQAFSPTQRDRLHSEYKDILNSEDGGM